MALAKKYAGLPDLDVAQEIYETPALTDDASTIQTDTLRTDSPTPSDEGGDERLIRQRIDADSARRRFEPTLVDAKGVNFSDTIEAGGRRSYRTRSRRRRRRDYHDGSGSDSDEETLASRIARLRREAEEVKLELARKDDGEFKEAVEQQQGPSEEDSLEELSKLIHGLEAPSAPLTNGKKEDEFLKSLSTTGNAQMPKPEATKPDTQQPAGSTSTPPSTTSALATFADRLTALESALGLSSVSSSAPSILPTLETLSTQLSNLTTTLAPTTRPSQSQSTASNATPNIDALQARVRALSVEADKLAASRRTALASLSELHDARMRFSQTRHSRDRPTSGAPPGAASPSPAPNNAGAMDKTEAGIHSDLFLSEHASKITALYQVLPSITELQPLLPVVLERLRSLSVIHAGAAEARGELDDVLRRQGEMREEVKRWRTAVEETEQRMGEVGGEMKRNVEVVGGMVRGCEEKVLELQKQKS